MIPPMFICYFWILEFLCQEYRHGVLVADIAYDIYPFPDAARMPETFLIHSRSILRHLFLSMERGRK